MVLQVLYWVLLVIFGVSSFVPLGGNWGRLPAVVLVILLAILGFFLFGNPVHR